MHISRNKIIEVNKWDSCRVPYDPYEFGELGDWESATIYVYDFDHDFSESLIQDTIQKVPLEPLTKLEWDLGNIELKEGRYRYCIKKAKVVENGEQQIRNELSTLRGETLFYVLR